MNKVYSLLIILGVFLPACTNRIKLDSKTAAVYSFMSSQEQPIPVALNYAIIYKVDDRYIGFDEDPIILSAGTHKLSLKIGKCLAPILTIACDFQPKQIKQIEFQFDGGKKYRLTGDGRVFEYL
jgi:hypothetical protein